MLERGHRGQGLEQGDQSADFQVRDEGAHTTKGNGEVGEETESE